MPSEPGKCYAKCLIQEEFEIYYEELAMFTGDIESTNATVETIDFEVSPATTKWVKKKADKNCLSANPDDCLVWCLVEVPASFERISIVTDTSSTDEYQILDFEKKRLSKAGGYTEWREVVCEKYKTVNFMESVQNALIDRGYYGGSVNGIMNAASKDALIKFQKDNGFPVGQLDVESLTALGVDF